MRRRRCPMSPLTPQYRLDEQRRRPGGFDMRATVRFAATIVAVIGWIGGAAAPASAVLRSCGGDAVANTANVLCAAPSGPCDASTVQLSAAIEVTSGGCTFDLQN